MKLRILCTIAAFAMCSCKPKPVENPTAAVAIPTQNILLLDPQQQIKDDKTEVQVAHAALESLDGEEAPADESAALGLTVMPRQGVPKRIDLGVVPVERVDLLDVSDLDFPRPRGTSTKFGDAPKPEIVTDIKRNLLDMSPYLINRRLEISKNTFTRKTRVKKIVDGKAQDLSVEVKVASDPQTEELDRADVIAVDQAADVVQLYYLAKLDSKKLNAQVGPERASVYASMVKQFHDVARRDVDGREYRIFVKRTLVKPDLEEIMPIGGDSPLGMRLSGVKVTAALVAKMEAILINIRHNQSLVQGGLQLRTALSNDELVAFRYYAELLPPAIDYKGSEVATPLRNELQRILDEPEVHVHELLAVLPIREEGNLINGQVTFTGVMSEQLKATKIYKEALKRSRNNPARRGQPQ